MYQNILHATDLAADHYAMCEKSLKIANTFNTDLHIIHIIEPPASLQVAQGLGFTEIYNPTAAQENAEEILKMIGESLNIPQQRLSVVIGPIKEQIKFKITELNSNLLILGKHESQNLIDLEGDTTQEIEKSINCDVLTIHS